MDASQGLTSAEARKRLLAYGANRIDERRRSRALALLAKLNGPVAWMLEASFVLELVLRNHVEAVIIGALLVVNAVLSLSQEERAQRALQTMRRRLAVTARVKRDGQWGRLGAEDVVPGDVLHVRMGDLVPADLRLVEGEVLLDQSSLTGESAPVEARAESAAYSGSVVRRGEATGVVTATGAKSYFGKTAELVRFAKAESHLEKLIAGIVKYLVAIDAMLALTVVVAAVLRAMSLLDVLPFVLMLLIASVPIALPATFTLASALGALDLGHDGVLVTRLSAIEEAAAMEVLCSDKTGTLTENRLSLVDLRPIPPADDLELLRLASFACDEATQDPLDLAVLRLVAERGATESVSRLRFVPFDPATKRAEAEVRRRGRDIRVVKGAVPAVARLASPPADIDQRVAELASKGERVLAVAAGDEAELRFVGLLGFIDPPRADSRAQLQRLRDLGVRVVMVTGDALPTARAVAEQLGIGGRVADRDALAHAVDFDVLAGTLPEDKFHLVQSLQRAGCVVGMTGDGVNDAPALKQADVGVAVESAADVAKAAASVVLTREGLAGVVASVQTGRRIYQRMLTYTLNKIVKTIEIALFLSLGFLVTGQLVTTPRLVLLLLLTNDFVTMSIARDRVTFSPKPDRWNVRSLVLRAGALAVAWLAFSTSALLVGHYVLHLELRSLQTLAFLVLVFGGQANVYLVRERAHLWRSRPSALMLGASAADVIIVTLLASTGTVMAPVAPSTIGALAVASALYMLLLDVWKVLSWK